MATKEDLEALIELGKSIVDTEKRNRHFDILQGIAERIGVTLTNDDELQEVNGVEGEQAIREEVDEEETKDQKQAEEQKKREEAQRKVEKEREEKRKVEEERARKQAEQKKREDRERIEREVKEREAKEQAAKLQQRASFRKSMPVGSLSKLTGNSLDEVLARIPKPNARGADLTDPSVAQVYVDVRDDNNPTDWMLLRYEGQTNKLKVTNSGSGGFKELVAAIVDEPLYGYFRYTFGDTHRTKFIFLSYVPDKLNGLKKAKVAGHKPEVAAFLKYFHVEINALSRDEISVSKLEAKLRSAGGADYGSGRGGGTSGGENFGGIKANAANFYAVKDKESKVDIVYQKGPLTTTPIDLSGRPMVAAASEARKNIVDLS